MSDEHIIVCGPRAHIDGSTMTRCEKCGAGVWISPTGRTMHARGDVTIVCTWCAVRLIEADPNPVLLPPTNAQLAELALYDEQKRHRK